jgi:hypothetical protein
MAITMMRTTIVATILLAGQVMAQERPPELMDMTSKTPATSHFNYIEKLDDAQRRFYWKNTTRNPSGYHEMIESDARGLNIIDRMVQRKTTSTGSKPSIFQSVLNTDRLVRIQYLGELRESKYRATFFFRDTDNTLIMLTATDMVGNGQTMWLIREFLNVDVGANKGTLTLSLHGGSKKGLWNLGWPAGNNYYELLVNDTIDEHRRPTKRPQEIIDIAQQLVRSSAGAVAK